MKAVRTILALCTCVVTARGQFLPLLLAHSGRPATNWSVPLAWTGGAGSNGVMGYYLHATNTHTSLVLDVGATNRATVVLPLPEERTYFWACNYSYSREEFPGRSNTMFCPGDEIIEVSGTELVAFPELVRPDKRFTNSPWCGTNVTGHQFFECADGAGPRVVRRTFYGY